MIENNQQLKVTQESLRKFKRSLKRLDAADPSEYHHFLLKAQKDGLRSMIEEFERDIKAYKKGQKHAKKQA